MPRRRRRRDGPDPNAPVQVGRPTLLTEEVHNKIISYVALGTPLKYVCDAVGISYECLREWNVRGENGDEAYVAFAAALKRAKGDFFARNLDKIRTASDDHWQAAAWLLERRDPREFGRTVQEHTGTVDQRVEIAVSFDGPEARARFNQLINTDARVIERSEGDSQRQSGGNGDGSQR